MLTKGTVDHSTVDWQLDFASSIEFLLVGTSVRWIVGNTETSTRCGEELDCTCFARLETIVSENLYASAGSLNVVQWLSRYCYGQAE
jgi:hypothetical protein